MREKTENEIEKSSVLGKREQVEQEKENEMLFLSASFNIWCCERWDGQSYPRKQTDHPTLILFLRQEKIVTSRLTYKLICHHQLTLPRKMKQPTTTTMPSLTLSSFVVILVSTIVSCQYGYPPFPPSYGSLYGGFSQRGFNSPFGSAFPSGFYSGSPFGASGMRRSFSTPFSTPFSSPFVPPSPFMPPFGPSFPPMMPPFVPPPSGPSGSLANPFASPSRPTFVVTRPDGRPLRYGFLLLGL